MPFLITWNFNWACEGKVHRISSEPHDIASCNWLQLCCKISQMWTSSELILCNPNLTGKNDIRIRSTHLINMRLKGWDSLRRKSERCRSRLSLCAHRQASREDYQTGWKGSFCQKSGEKQEFMPFGKRGRLLRKSTRVKLRVTLNH